MASQPEKVAPTAVVEKYHHGRSSNVQRVDADGCSLAAGLYGEKAAPDHSGGVPPREEQ